MRSWPMRRLGPNDRLTGVSAACLLAALAACSGPMLHVENPEQHVVYVDGVAIGRVARAAEPEGRPTVRGDAAATAGGEPVEPAGRPTHYVIPYRYYGTARWHAEPAANADGTPDFDRLPATGAVAIEAAASPLLFPLDFPIDLFDRLLHGRRDRTLRIAVPDAPAALRGDIEISPAALGELSARARAARIER